MYLVEGKWYNHEFNKWHYHRSHNARVPLFDKWRLIVLRKKLTSNFMPEIVQQLFSKDTNQPRVNFLLTQQTVE